MAQQSRHALGISTLSEFHWESWNASPIIETRHINWMSTEWQRNISCIWNSLWQQVDIECDNDISSKVFTDALWVSHHPSLTQLRPLISAFCPCNLPQKRLTHTHSPNKAKHRNIWSWKLWCDTVCPTVHSSAHLQILITMSHWSGHWSGVRSLVSVTVNFNKML